MEIGKVKDLVELLLKCPQDNLIMAEISGYTDDAEIVDVLVGNGTTRGLTYIKIEPYNPTEITPDWKTHVTDRFSKVN